MGNIVRKRMGEIRISEERKLELASLAERPDSDIDLSEMPELTEEFWQNAIPNPWYRPVKKQVTVRIDADVLEWLRRQGETGYQSRLNAVLRKVMLEELGGEQRRA